ncbi:MAG: acyl carrier protein [Planctomycetota bacterium]
MAPPPPLDDLRRFVARILRCDVAVLQDDTDLLATGLLDSLQVVELATELERGWGILLDAWDLTPENFASVGALRCMLDAKLAA